MSDRVHPKIANFTPRVFGDGYPGFPWHCLQMDAPVCQVCGHPFWSSFNSKELCDKHYGSTSA